MYEYALVQLKYEEVQYFVCSNIKKTFHSENEIYRNDRTNLEKQENIQIGRTLKLFSQLISVFLLSEATCLDDIPADSDGGR